MVHITLLGLVLCLYFATATPFNSNTVSKTTDYPLPNQGHVAAHDPNILRYDNQYYLFKGGVKIPVFRAPELDGPWERIGTVLDDLSTVPKQNRRRPWAPTVTYWRNRFYCFYSISKNGARNSAIGLASSDSIEPGTWTDHGALINTGTGPLSNIYPYNVTNAIDPAFFADPQTESPYLQYGSYWDGIFQIPLTDDLSIENPTHPDADHLVYIPDEKRKPSEGSFMNYRAPYYYVWFSHGQCCRFEQEGFPTEGKEYSIRLGRSESVHGPFVDRESKDLLDGGGTVIYGSNHGKVYAPGGLGILSSSGDDPDVLYYHYHNTSIGFAQGDAQLGWNYLDYVDGWPVPRAPASRGSNLQPTSYLTFVALLCMCCLVYTLHYKGLIGRKSTIPLVFLIALAFLWIQH
ncbi:glycosyl hydrolase [Aspergillus cavernicola]|uniref:Glycosyl hydrolase n=1 Tax=Aspergillus cavernicola TaxID=176166 RepID=A0ABR4J4Q6_9EURO